MKQNVCNFTVYCDMFTHRQLFRSRTVELFGEKPDFNPFKNNNNQIEKLPKKQKKTIRNVSTNQSLNYLFYSFPSPLNVRAQMQFR